MSHPKVVIVGAGSLFFGRKAIWQMVHSHVLNTGTLALVDTDAGRLEKMKLLAQKVIAHNKSKLKLEASTDHRDVLKDADFVVLCFADRNAHFRHVDVTISEKYGIRMCSGDTIGPGGIFRTMREMPKIEQVCNSIRTLCPNAWVINYINPTAVHGIALQRYYPDLKFVALCDAQWGLRAIMAKAAGVPDDDKWRLQTAGPNHFSWLLRAEYDGKDMTPVIIEGMRRKADEDINIQAQGGKNDPKGLLNNAISVELYDMLGVLPTVTGHTKEYVRYYQAPGVANRNKIPPLSLFDAPARVTWTNNVWQRVDDYNSGKVDIAEFDKEFGPDPATDLIEAMWGNLGKRFFVNVPNRGAITNMADDAFLELYSDVSMSGFKPLPVGPMPRGVRGMCEKILDTHELTAQAVHETDRTLLRRAMLVDPLATSVGDIEALIEDLLEAEKDAVSPKWLK